MLETSSNEHRGTARGTAAAVACLAVALLLAAGCRSAAPAAGAATQAAAPIENTIRWATSSELDNFGFDVYRGDSEDGPFDKLTEQAIQGAGTTDVPQKYQYVDRGIEPCRAYYYFVESIAMNGVRERFTPVVRAKPKGGDECAP